MQDVVVGVLVARVQTESKVVVCCAEACVESVVKVAEARIKRVFTQRTQQKMRSSAGGNALQPPIPVTFVWRSVNQQLRWIGLHWRFGGRFVNGREADVIGQMRITP